MAAHEVLELHPKDDTKERRILCRRRASHVGASHFNTKTQEHHKVLKSSDLFGNVDLSNHFKTDLRLSLAKFSSNQSFP